MEFKHERARQAYKEICAAGESHSVMGHLPMETIARATEVAAKIEIECERLEVEKMKGWIPATPRESRHCPHDWHQNPDTTATDLSCKLCGAWRGK